MNLYIRLFLKNATACKNELNEICSKFEVQDDLQSSKIAGYCACLVCTIPSELILKACKQRAEAWRFNQLIIICLWQTFNKTYACLHEGRRRNSNNLQSLKGLGISTFEKEDFSIAHQQLVCSGTVPQRCEFGSSGPTSTEQLEKLAADDGK